MGVIVNEAGTIKTVADNPVYTKIGYTAIGISDTRALTFTAKYVYAMPNPKIGIASRMDSNDNNTNHWAVGKSVNKTKAQTTIYMSSMVCQYTDSGGQTGSSVLTLWAATDYVWTTLTGTNNMLWGFNIIYFG